SVGSNASGLLIRPVENCADKLLRGAILRRVANESGFPLLKFQRFSSGSRPWKVDASSCNGPLSKSDGDHVRGDMGRVLLMVTKHCYGLLRSRRPMKKSRGPKSRFTDWPAVYEDLRAFSNPEVIPSGEFH